MESSGSFGCPLSKAPEIKTGPLIDFKADIFSLGIIYFELLQFFAIEEERYSMLNDLREGELPDSWLSDNPDERPTAREVQDIAPWKPKVMQFYELYNSESF